MDTSVTASAFSEWVFNVTKGRSQASTAPPTHVVEQERQERLRWGKLDHAEIDRIRKRLGDHMEGRTSDYVVQFADDEHQETVFTASRLRIGSRALRCRPDLVLKNAKRKHVIIVERKTTRQWRLIDQTEGSNWANIEAQLWCYSYIDTFLADERITLIGELWRALIRSPTAHAGGGWKCHALDRKLTTAARGIVREVT